MDKHDIGVLKETFYKLTQPFKRNVYFGRISMPFNSIIRVSCVEEFHSVVMHYFKGVNVYIDGMNYYFPSQNSSGQDYTLEELYAYDAKGSRPILAKIKYPITLFEAQNCDTAVKCRIFLTDHATIRIKNNEMLDFYNASIKDIVDSLAEVEEAVANPEGSTTNET